MPVSYERHGEAAVVTFDNPPLNVFGQAMRAGLQAAIARARAERPERLPRLIGMAAAVDLIGQGRSVTAAQALDLGLVDVLAEDPLAAALSLPQETLRRAIAADHRPAPLPDGAAITAAHAQANRRAAGQEAPHLAIDLVAAAATEPLDQALLRERATFIARRPSAQARALRHIFFAERAAASQGRAYPAPAKPVESAIVVGGGLMGAGIAYALTLSGLTVHVVETDAAGEARARANLDKLIAQGVDRGSISDAAAFHARLTVRAGYDALPPVDLAIEAAFESMEVKRTIFAALQAALPETTVLATNTSYLDVDALAAGITDPGRFLGLHFFAPAHVMKLLEIVRGAETSQAALGVGFALAKRLGKIPVVAGVCDGFIGNRILARYRQTADVLMIEGSCPKGIDAAMRGFGMAMGPYEAQDMSGLDIAHANRKRQNLRARSDIRYVPIADTLVEDLGRLGRKSGAGWYDYDAAGKAVESDAVTQVIYRAADAAGITRIARSPEEIAERALLAQLETLAAEDPLSWEVPNLLRKLARQKQNFQSLNT